VQALVGRLAELGWEEGRNLRIDAVHAAGIPAQPERLASTFARLRLRL
jgi:hypothetical protein